MNPRYSFQKLARFVCVCAVLGLSTNGTAQMSCGEVTTSSHQPDPFANRSLISQASLQFSYCVKIYIHVIRDDDGNGGQPIDRVHLAVNNLNLNFNPLNIYFKWDGAIDYIDDSSTDDGTPGYYNQVHQTIFGENPHTDGVDIYLFPNETGPWGGVSHLGVGNGTAVLIAGNYFNDVAIPVITTPFLSHEMGHVLGLWHTFHGTYQNSEENQNDPNACPELPNNSDGNGDNCGDYISDTPADPNMDFKVNPTTCQWNFPIGGFTPSTSNYMAYTHPNCMTNFTPIQVQTMKSRMETLPHLQNVVDTECCVSANLDLFIKDSPEDFGLEYNTVTENMWESEDIWVRNIDDNGQTHQNPEYNADGTPNYIYVRVLNRSCENSTGQENVTINWAKANTDLQYPEDWNGTHSTSGGEPMSGILPPVNIPIMGFDDEQIIKIPWVIPNPDDYTASTDPWHFCLLASILGGPDGLQPTDYTENPNEMVRNQNNLAWKNISVVDLEDGIISAMVMVANPSSYQRTFTLEFVVEASEPGKAIYTEAEVGVQMDDDLFTIWERGGKQQSQLVNTSVEEKKQISSNHAKLDNLIFNSKEQAMLTLNFNMLVKELTAKNKYTIRAIQKDKITNEVIGGETYVIYKDLRESFSATAGEDKEIDSDQTITISPEQINEAATYNWYDPNGNLIYQGTTLTVTAAMAETYTLEVIADADGYKDYDEVEITLKPSRIETVSPNPLTIDALQINYKLNNVASAYLMIVDQNSGVSQNYILNTATSNTTLNLSAYTNGFYTIALVCDSEIVDAQTFIKQ